MFKVAAFCKRNKNLLTHDEYRAGHAGYHNSHSRRMRGMRGYCLNVRANDDMRKDLGDLYERLTVDEPDEFDDLWDGFPIVHYDSAEAWRVDMRQPDRAGPSGLIEDEEWVAQDGPYLFEQPFYHQRLDEAVAVPVVRPEYKLTKIIQFFRRNPAISQEDFRTSVLEEYSLALGGLPGLHGCLVNLRDRDIFSADEGRFPATHYVFTEEGRALTKAFCDLWDGFSELWFDSMKDFRHGRTLRSVVNTLDAMENDLFSSIWYNLVDETVVIVPNRGFVPSFYYR